MRTETATERLSDARLENVIRLLSPVGMSGNLIPSSGPSLNAGFYGLTHPRPQWPSQKADDTANSESTIAAIIKRNILRKQIFGGLLCAGIGTAQLTATDCLAGLADTIPLQSTGDSLTINSLKDLYEAFGQPDPTDESVADHQAAAMAFLNTIYSDAQAGKSRAAMQSVFRYVSELMLAGDEKSCDAMLIHVDVDKLPVDVALSFVTSTFPGRDALPSRPALLNRVLARIKKERTDDDANALIDRFR